MNRHKFSNLVLLITVVMLSSLSIGRTSVQASGEPITELNNASAVYLPLVNYTCVPGLPGDSDNVHFAITVCSGQTLKGQVSTNDRDDVYKILSKANQKLTISMNGTGGDADLFLFPPGTTDIDTGSWAAASGSDDNYEYIQYTVLEGGFWYIDVYSYGDSTNYNLTIILSSP
jgi:hypothetical protein